MKRTTTTTTDLFSKLNAITWLTLIHNIGLDRIARSPCSKQYNDISNVKRIFVLFMPTKWWWWSFVLATSKLFFVFANLLHKFAQWKCAHFEACKRAIECCRSADANCQLGHLHGNVQKCIWFKWNAASSGYDIHTKRVWERRETHRKRERESDQSETHS